MAGACICPRRAAVQRSREQRTCGMTGCTWGMYGPGRPPEGYRGPPIPPGHPGYHQPTVRTQRPASGSPTSDLPGYLEQFIDNDQKVPKYHGLRCPTEVYGRSVSVRSGGRNPLFWPETTGPRNVRPVYGG